MPYHINAKGEPGFCHAQAGTCPFGDEHSHYASERVARTVYEMEMGEYGLPGHSKKLAFTSKEQFLEEAAVADPEPYYEIWGEMPQKLGFSPARAGLQSWRRHDVEIPHQADTFWDSYKEVLVDPQQHTFRTSQELVRYGGVRHYLSSPEEALEDFTEEEGLAVKAVLIDGDIYIQEGNHRTAAACLARRPLLMKLAPEEAARAYWREQAFSA